MDNETGDWQYLLALRDLARSFGIVPAAFTKTGWPEPAAGYPAAYPMLPFFGGCAPSLRRSLCYLRPVSSTRNAP